MQSSCFTIKNGDVCVHLSRHIMRWLRLSRIHFRPDSDRYVVGQLAQLKYESYDVMIPFILQQYEGIHKAVDNN